MFRADPEMSVALDCRKRVVRLEEMDRPGLEPDRHTQALRALRRINVISATAAVVYRPIRELAMSRPGRALRVLDVACGGGDVAIALWKRARRDGIPLMVRGCDINPSAVNYAARQAALAQSDARFFTHDVISHGTPNEFDIITSSLFLHHLTDDQALRWLRDLARAARELVLISDLIRCRAGFLLACLASRVLTASPIVRFDAPASVAAAFTIEEAQSLADRAGLSGHAIERTWPFRFLLIWRRQ